MKLEEYSLFRTVTDPVTDRYYRATFAALVDLGYEDDEAHRLANNATVHLTGRMFAILEDRLKQS